MFLNSLHRTVKGAAASLHLTHESKIHRLARRQGYEVAGSLKYGRLYKLCRGNEPFILKFVVPNGLIAHREVLPALTGPYQRMAVPHVAATGECSTLGCWIIADWHEGHEYSKQWDEQQPEVAGGRAIDADTIPLLLDVIEDLRSLNAERFINLGLERRTAAWLRNRIQNQLGRASAWELLSGAQEKHARTLFEAFLERVDHGTIQISNHDFQFRNLIRLSDDRIKVVDWDAARISTFETEHCIAYQWMLMWNRPEWQRQFLAEARQRLPLSPELFRGVLLVNTLNQGINVYGEFPDLRAILFSTFLNLLDDRYYTYVWEG